MWIGGPVEPQRSWMLVGEEPDASEELRGMRIADGLYLSTSPDLLRRLLEPSPPDRTRLIVGYSGWGAGAARSGARRIGVADQRRRSAI